MARLWVTGLLLLYAACSTALAEPSPLLILISIDGYRTDYLEKGHSPVLASLAAEGVRAKGMRPVYPSITFPNHYTLVTGLYPDEHGIVNNTMQDPARGYFRPGDPASNGDRRWWDQAEPIWVTAQKQGQRTASVFWPGTQAEIHGVRPNYWQLFDSTMPPNKRVDQALAWLDLPEDRRPSFVSLYFEQVDSAGHSYGPDSPQVDEALATVDAALGRLVTGLKQRNRLDNTNLVIVSDHGMTDSSPIQTLLLERVTKVDLDHIEIVSTLVNLGVNPKLGFEAEVEKAMIGRHLHLSCWKKSQMPQKFHYGKSPRIPAIQCLPDSGWMVSTKAEEDKRVKRVLGEHGYDPDDPKMYALFVAHGPSFKQHLTVPVFDNINVYSLLTKLTGVTPLPNAGDPAATADMLRAPPDWH
jgi:predicted AlkP superfamily pyrophosphatase or phosphodiesterase